MTNKVILSFLFLLVLSSSALFSANSFAQAQQIPAEVFGALPEYEGPQLSPSGTKIAFIKNVTHPEHRSLLATYDFKTGKQTLLFSSDNETVGFRWFQWANEDTLLVSLRFLTRKGSSRYTHTRMMSLKYDEADQDPVFLLAPKRNREARGQRQRDSQIGDIVVDMLKSDADHILAAIDNHTFGMPSVYKVNLKTGKSSTVEMGKHNIRDWTTDQQGRLRIGEAFDYETGESIIYERKTNDDSWRKIYTFRPIEDPSKVIYVQGFGLDPNVLYITKYKGYHLALYKVALDTMEETLVYSHDEYDVDGSLVRSTLTGEVIGVNHRSAKYGIHFFDIKDYALHDALANAIPDQSNYLLNTSIDQRKYLMYSQSSNTPGRFYIGDRDKGSLNYLFGEYAKIDPNVLSTSKRVVYKARDGLEIEAFITLPKAGKAPYPLIVHPHGGPGARDTGGFDYWAQFFASRGYAVIQPNFRGSSGFGLDFSEAQMRAWGLQMQDDLSDAANWMIAEGYADKNKMCIAGASYGGYAATMATVKTPNLFKCAVSFAGVTDLFKRVKRQRNDFLGGELIAKNQIGDDTSDLKKRSPLHNAEKITASTLLAHGEYDDVVNIEQSRIYASTLKNLGKDVEYLELKDGDHYLSNSKNRQAFFKAMDAFLSTHLK